MDNLRTNPHRGHGTKLWILLGLVIAGCLAGYLLLRAPVVRESLADLVRHRPRIGMSMERRLLAPRSVLLAGIAGIGVLGLCFLSRAFRTQLTARVPEGQRLVIVFIAVQAAITMAVVVNLQTFFLRTYDQRPLWRIPEEEVLARLVPDVRSHAEQLKALFPDGARLAVRVASQDLGRDAGDRYMLHALAYPVALFDLSPTTPDWSDDSRFVETAHRYGIQYIFKYRQYDRKNPFELEPFQWELSGWRH